jgi:deoxycytidylate deaminase
VVTPELSEVLAVGYNGPPRGSPNDACRGGEGSCGCIHGEANAIAKLSGTRDGLVLLTTTAPCEHCAGLVVNCMRVGYIVYGRAYRDPAGLGVLGAAGVVAVSWRSVSGLETENPPV